MQIPATLPRAQLAWPDIDEVTIIVINLTRRGSRSDT